MSTRRRCREIVLQLLYEHDLGGTRTPEAARAFIKSRLQGRKALTDFADRLLSGTLKHRDQVDRQLSRLSTHWTLPRMPATDRNVLRLGAYEILFGGTPGQVAVSEAILLAKRYGDRNSPRFVNGVLDRLYKEHIGQVKPAVAPETGGAQAVDGHADQGPSANPGLSDSAKLP
ncbi:hypothetical protein V7x_21520 [Crateriforma conspicua]|uniref:Transcription antitermination protein NusB n=1 Tax=Crateriforma conspicua TaxID=2527996 RepID=A0A5C6FW82_9PLAN|nr:transcription antitermination factor NusB [Crateriforma conspicua]TWU66584.1 hypothetical protein V7x_21520 [Crateriforma conspicua]